MYTLGSLYQTSLFHGQYAGSMNAKMQTYAHKKRVQTSKENISFKKNQVEIGKAKSGSKEEVAYIQCNVFCIPN